MKQHSFVLQVLGVMAMLFASMQAPVAQATPEAAGVPVSMVVTVQSHHGSDVSNISAANVIVYQSRARAKVTDWVPLQGDRANLELFILLDDSPSTSRGSQLEDIRNFIMAQPATTKIGVANSGAPQIVQTLTTDHALAADALHVSLGKLARGASPYVSLRDLIKQWPASSARREILVISSGVDQVFGDSGTDNDNTYVDSAITEAQSAGVIVSTIATTGEGSGVNRDSGPPSIVATSPGSDLSRVNPAKTHLSQIAEETGGESYYHPFGAPISFAPYLDDCALRLTHQYLLTFLATPGKKAGTQPVKVRTELAHTELVSAAKVYVPGPGKGQ